MIIDIAIYLHYNAESNFITALPRDNRIISRLAKEKIDIN